MHISYYKVTIDNKVTLFSHKSLVEKSLEISFKRDPKGEARLAETFGSGQHQYIRQGMKYTGQYTWEGGEIIGKCEYFSLHIEEEVHHL